MADFIVEQVDYILFLRGLAFFVFAVACIYPRSADRPRLPWTWLALFALTHALASWLGLLSSLPAIGQKILVTRICMVTLSLLFLVEFGRIGTISIKGKGPGRWILVPLVVAAAFGCKDGLPGLEVMAGRVLGSVGALWTAAVLIFGLKDAAPAAKALIRIAGVICTSAITISLVVPGFRYLSMIIDSQSTPHVILACLVDLSLAATAIFAAAAVSIHPKSAYQTTLDSSGAHKRMRISSWAAISIMVILVAGWFAASYWGKSRENECRSSLIARTRTAASAIDREDLSRLTGTESDLDGKEYWHLHNHLKHIARVNPDIRYAYILDVRDGNVVFLADSGAVGTEGYTPPGTIYEEIPAQAKALFIRPSVDAQGPYTDRWGTWVSGFVPVYSKSNQFLGFMCLDISAEELMSERADRRLCAIVIVLLLCIVTITFFLILHNTKESGDRIATSEQCHRGLVECSPNSVLLFDQDSRCLTINKAGYKNMGWLDADIIGKKLCDVLPEAVHSELNNAIKQVFQGKQSSLEIEYARPDGSRMALQMLFNGITSPQGEIQQFVGIFIDITKHKRIEEELQKAKDVAESANRAKSEFLANMSHEIRTPMNGIIGMTELALDTNLAPEQREYLTAVKSSADSLLSLLNDILDFSKIEAGRLDIDSTDFNLRDTIENTATALAVRAHQKNLELACDIPADVPGMLIGDSNRLRQILVNLVGNAIKFTEHGEVVIRVETESQSDEDAVLHLSVRDTGIGITQDKLEVIFGAFEQADSSTTRRYGGTGLGLTISSKLAQLMGGRIWAESEVGKGSTFHFTVRFGLQKFAVARTPKPAVALKGLPVLVVDDNETNRRILQEMLANWQMRPMVVDSGSKALQIMNDASDNGRPFALVLLDAQMPEMDGFAVAEAIKNNPKFVEATVMMLTSSDRYGDSKRCRELGIVAHLIKPIRQSDLMDRIMSLMGSPDISERCTEEVGADMKDRMQGRSILLVEDNLVNRKLALHILEKDGYSVTAAVNGKEALAVLEESAFDLVLMDVQMPVMDGFEATAAIREMEKVSGRHMPIVAMTAHAMKGDRERCLKAGMDDYLIKPLNAKMMLKIIDRLVSDNLRDIADDICAEPGGAIVDVEAMMTRVGGDNDLLAEIIDLFLDDYPKLMNELKSAIDRADNKVVERTAHTIKGSVGNFTTGEGFEAALVVEQMGRSGNMTGVNEAYKHLNDSLERLKSALSALVRKEAA